MAIVDLEYREWQKRLEAEQPHLFTQRIGLGPTTMAVAERRDLMRIAYSAGKAARGNQQVGEVQGIDLDPVRAALQAAEALCACCMSVDGYSRRELSMFGRNMRSQFREARALIDSQRDAAPGVGP
jgi:hypothetical protein